MMWQEMKNGCEAANETRGREVCVAQVAGGETYFPERAITVLERKLVTPSRSTEGTEKGIGGEGT